MRAIIIIFLCLASSPGLPHAEVLEELWDKYAPESLKGHAELPAPGLIRGQAPGTGESSFSYQWKYRPITYEMHFEDQETLAKGIRSLALHSHDISPNLPADTFYKGVTGFHYSVPQITAWLNNVMGADGQLTREENEFAAALLRDGIIGIGKGGFIPGASVRHVLGAAPGKRRTFAKNLAHERLHVFWDEDRQMRDQAQNAWDRLAEAEKLKIQARLKNYNQNNKNQILEEWAILEAEKGAFNIK